MLLQRCLRESIFENAELFLDRDKSKNSNAPNNKSNKVTCRLMVRLGVLFPGRKNVFPWGEGAITRRLWVRSS